MPGHIIGIDASVSLIMDSDDPMSYSKADWRKVEQALGSLKGKKVGSHRIVEVTISSLRPTAAAISAHIHPDKIGTRAKSR